MQNCALKMNQLECTFIFNYEKIIIFVCITTHQKNKIMNIEEILNRVDNVKPESNYWFVRTDYGKYFNEFVENRYIAIG